MIAFLMGPLGKLAGWAAAAVAAIGAVWAAWSAAKSSGVQKQQMADLKATLDNVKVQQDVEAETRSAGPAGVSNGLRKWTRDQ